MAESAVVVVLKARFKPFPIGFLLHAHFGIPRERFSEERKKKKRMCTCVYILLHCIRLFTNFLLLSSETRSYYLLHLICYTNHLRTRPQFKKVILEMKYIQATTKTQLIIFLCSAFRSSCTFVTLVIITRLII